MQYKTKQKQAVIDCLINNTEKNMTAYDIFQYLKAQNLNISLTTVYRTLDSLIAQGAVKKYLLPDLSSACFQFISKCSNCDNHLHLKCTACGKLIHLDCKFADEIDCHILKHHNFSVDNKNTVLYGMCRECEKLKNLESKGEENEQK